LAGCFLARESGLRGADDPVKTTKLIAGFPAALVAVLSAQAQGFVNLNFEMANVAGYSPDTLIPITAALPGWSGFYQNSQTSQVGYDFVSLGAAVISVIDNNSQPDIGPLVGNYSADLFGGAGQSASISQTGLVPAGTESLLFDAYDYGAPFIVTLGGQAINVSPLQAFQNYTVYGGDIPSSLAGQIETLSFTEPPPAIGGPSMFELDDISFSTNAPTPEPSIVALTAIGGLLFGARKWFARRG
jgi:hypothetical protein